MRYAATIWPEGKDKPTVIGRGHTAAKAIKDAQKQAKGITATVRIDLLEDGQSVFWTAWLTVEAATEQALAMDKKSRTGGGR